MDGVVRRRREHAAHLASMRAAALQAASLAARPTIQSMLERAQTRALPLVNKGAELAPVQACCGVCRTCVTTNVLTLALAGGAGAAVYLTRGLRRLLARTQ